MTLMSETKNLDYLCLKKIWNIKGKFWKLSLIAIAIFIIVFNGDIGNGSGYINRQCQAQYVAYHLLPKFKKKN